ncbi:50S ribosomal protein L35 [bacterium]|jgi:large subunit ribosomal protein L35|nr:50S ribosomal protein L35 [bacterium]MBT5015508.1 50S ribosomal protein L35 [bacterium]
MPKMKTSSSAKKRFKKKKNGAIKRAKAFRRHCLGCKSQKQKRHLRKAGVIAASDHKTITQLLAS